MPGALLGHAWSSLVPPGVRRAQEGCAHPLLTDVGRKEQREGSFWEAYGEEHLLRLGLWMKCGLVLLLLRFSHSGADSGGSRVADLEHGCEFPLHGAGLTTETRFFAFLPGNLMPL